MAGGTWASQNKVRPGVYIRFASDRGLGLTVSDRGVVAIAEAMSWGPVETVQEIEAGANMTPGMTSPIPRTGSSTRSSRAPTGRRPPISCCSTAWGPPGRSRQAQRFRP